jgi:MFS family permease
MAPVAFVLFAREATGSFRTAGLVLAASTLGALGLAPLRGRLVDRVGPRAAILRLALPSAATDVAFILAGHARVAAPLLVVLAFVAGAIAAPAGAALRTAWSHLIGASETRQAGYALMSVLQELTFVTGPLVAGGIIALGSATAAVATAAALNAAGALAFATSAAAKKAGGVAAGVEGDAATGGGTAVGGEAAPGGGTAAGGPAVIARPGRRGRLPAALAGRGMRVVVATSGAFGAAFGTLDVALPAFARAHGAVALAGVLLSALAAGIGAGGFAYGLRAHPPARQRYSRLCLLAAAGLAPLVLVPPLGAMAGLVFLAGLAFAPITATQIAVIDDVSAAAHRAEAFTWLTTAYGAGSAAGAAVAGLLELRAAFAVACGVTAAGWLISRSLARTTRRSAGRP